MNILLPSFFLLILRVASAMGLCPERFASKSNLSNCESRICGLGAHIQWVSMPMSELTRPKCCHNECSYQIEKMETHIPDTRIWHREAFLLCVFRGIDKISSKWMYSVTHKLVKKLPVAWFEKWLQCCQNIEASLFGYYGYINITVTSQWTRWHFKSPASRLFTQPFIQAQIKENIKAPRPWPLFGEFTGDSPHKGPVTLKCFHWMTSSWINSGCNERKGMSLSRLKNVKKKDKYFT